VRADALTNADAWTVRRTGLEEPRAFRADAREVARVNVGATGTRRNPFARPDSHAVATSIFGVALRQAFLLPRGTTTYNSSPIPETTRPQ